MRLSPRRQFECSRRGQIIQASASMATVGPAGVTIGRKAAAVVNSARVWRQRCIDVIFESTRWTGPGDEILADNGESMHRVRQNRLLDVGETGNGQK